VANVRTRRAAGFTMVEALAAVALLAVGIVASLSALGAMTRAEGGMRESERMQRLADQKLQELIATGDWQFLTEGDFSEQAENRYLWTSTLEPSGVENMEVLSVTITRANRRDDEGYQATQLLYIPPEVGGAQSP
jgi:type II secretory pathway pseudopilin PulG